MKKIVSLVFLVALSLCIYGCSYSISPKVENFEAHLSSLSDDPESWVDFSFPYNKTKNLEDAFTKLCGYTSKDWYVSSSDAEDAWIYISHYLDALYADLDQLYKEYQNAY